MGADTGSLHIDQLFKGLTRPAMFLGVSFKFSVMNILCTVLAYVLTSNFLFLLVVLPGLHGIGYAICFHEPLFLELFMVRNQKCGKCSNKAYHGANSYDIT